MQVTVVHAKEPSPSSPARGPGPALVRSARAGDRAALRQLFERYQPAVTSFCLLRAGRDRDRALDLTQEIFARVFRSLDGLSDPDQFESWLFSIAANHCRSRGADAQRQRRLFEAVELERQVELGSDDKEARERRIETVREVLAGVEDPTVRAIATLKYGEPEHTTRDIAERLGIPHGTVTVKLMRFRAAIKRRLLQALAEAEER